jgi:hypothetical protein
MFPPPPPPIRLLRAVYGQWAEPPSRLYSGRDYLGCSRKGAAMTDLLYIALAIAFFAAATACVRLLERL